MRYDTHSNKRRLLAYWFAFVSLSLSELLLSSCGAARQGGIVDNGHHPDESGPDDKVPNSPTPDSQPNPNPAASAASPTILIGKVRVAIPLGFLVEELDNEHGVFKAEGFWIRADIQAPICAGTFMKENRYGTKVYRCDQTQIYFKTAGMAEMTVEYNLKDSDLELFIESVQDGK